MFRCRRENYVHIVVMVVCLILWVIIQNNLRAQGYEPLSRRQMRYMRKRARRMGLDVSEVPYKPRRGTNPFGPASIKSSHIEESVSHENEKQKAKEYKRADWPEVIPPGWTPPD
jgi:hypothetical protein